MPEATTVGCNDATPFDNPIARLRLPKMMEAITAYAVGGKAALEARGDEPANLLLEQMTAADRTLARSR